MNITISRITTGWLLERRLEKVSLESYLAQRLKIYQNPIFNEIASSCISEDDLSDYQQFIIWANHKNAFGLIYTEIVKCYSIYSLIPWVHNQVVACKMPLEVSIASYLSCNNFDKNYFSIISAYKTLVNLLTKGHERYQREIDEILQIVSIDNLNENVR